MRGARSPCLLTFYLCPAVECKTAARMQLCLQLRLQLKYQARALLRAQEVYVPPTGNLSLRGLVVAGNQGMLCIRMCKRDMSAKLCQSGRSSGLRMQAPS